MFVFPTAVATKLSKPAVIWQSIVSMEKIHVNHITESTFANHLLTNNNNHNHGDPDIMIRTSGEIRISNFWLWQLDYSEFFFLDKTWAELNKDDILGIIRSYAGAGRQRRLGK
mmetsp:Transcript_10515/g.13936  ORF Transcript_10515/g.13936 Transcript_10515/m.13936 type:complete len:113 (+) Transcript_10515:532-870(+)